MQASTVLLLPFPTHFPLLILGLGAIWRQVFWFAFVQHLLRDILPPTSSTMKMMMAQDSWAFMKGSLPRTMLRLMPPLSTHTHFSCSAVVLRVKPAPKFIAEEKPKMGSSEEGGRINHVS